MYKKKTVNKIAIPLLGIINKCFVDFLYYCIFARPYV
jgi:hypothetical protein